MTKDINNYTSQDILTIISHDLDKLSQLENEKIQNACTNMYRFLDSAQSKLDNGNFEEACYDFFAMGIIYNEINLKGLNRLLKEEIRIQPLRDKANKSKLLKEIAKQIGGQLWENDKENNIRIGEMCQLVWDELIDLMNESMEIIVKFENGNEINLTNALPDSANSLRPWLKGIAPDYAQLRGAPKKSKK